MDVIDERYIDLAAAIVHQAIADYKKALQNDDTIAQKECESFFRSAWGRWLTLDNGKSIMERCKAEVEKEKKKEEE